MMTKYIEELVQVTMTSTGNISASYSIFTWPLGVTVHSFLAWNNTRFCLFVYFNNNRQVVSLRKLLRPSKSSSENTKRTTENFHQDIWTSCPHHGSQCCQQWPITPVSYTYSIYLLTSKLRTSYGSRDVGTIYYYIYCKLFLWEKGFFCCCCLDSGAILLLLSKMK